MPFYTSPSQFIDCDLESSLYRKRCDGSFGNEAVLEKFKSWYIILGFTTPDHALFLLLVGMLYNEGVAHELDEHEH